MIVSVLSLTEVHGDDSRKSGVVAGMFSPSTFINLFCWARRTTIALSQSEAQCGPASRPPGGRCLGVGCGERYLAYRYHG